MANIGSEQDKAAMQLRLRRIEGQLRGIQKMIEEDRDCERIAQQMSAARKSLDRAFFEMVTCMLEHELIGEIGKKSRAHARVREATTILAKFA